MNSYVIDGYVYTSKAALGDAIRAILNRYLPGDVLDQADTDFMYDVIQMHPNAEEKIGCGIRGFGVQRNPKYGQSEFILIRKDSTQTDFSYNKCLCPPTQLGRFLQACRQSIGDGIIGFRDLYFRSTSNPVCELTGECLTPQTAHVDHAPPHTFRWIAETFMQKYRIDVSRVELKSGGDNSCTVYLPKDIEELWIAYHWQLAKLRVISASENMRRGTHGVELPVSGDVSQKTKDAVRREMEANGWVLRA